MLETPLAFDVLLAQPFICGMLFALTIPAYALSIGSVLSRDRSTAAKAAWIALVSSAGLLGMIFIGYRLLVKGVAPVLSVRPRIAPSHPPLELGEALLSFGLVLAVFPIVVSLIGLVLAQAKRG